VKPSHLIWLLAALACLALGMTVACGDNEDADVPPPGTNDPGNGDGDWTCDITVDDLESVEYFANCYEGAGADNVLTISEVIGGGEAIVDGRRFQIQGGFDFATIGQGKIEASIGCVSYDKCSFPFDEKTGAFVVRFDASGCGSITKPTEITLNVYDDETAASYPMCSVYLGGDPSADDDTPDDTWDCDIPEDGLAPVAFSANCFDPLDAGNVVSIDEALGTAALLTDGERFELRGTHDFSSITAGKLEMTIDCPAGSSYPKCSSEFEEAAGDFQLRLEVADCDPLGDDTTITVNVWNEGSGTTTPMCLVTLGATDDDTI
jgi:hypothetical protein